MKAANQNKFQSSRWGYLVGLILLCVLFCLPARAELTLPGSHASSLSIHSNELQTPEVKAKLLVYAPQGIRPDVPVWFGLLLQQEPQWHTYWKNPGDIGMATTLNWTLPPGVKAGEVQWPQPQRFPIDDEITNYGYGGTVLLPVPVSIAPDYDASQLRISLDVSWLACKVECIPGSGKLSLSVPTKHPIAEHAALFESTLQALPKSDAQVNAQVEVKTQPEPGVLVWRVEHLPQSMQGKPLLLYPEDEGIMSTASPLFSEWQQGVWVAAYSLKKYRSSEPQHMPALLVAVEEKGQNAFANRNEPGVLINAEVQGQWPTQEKAGSISPDFLAGVEADRAAVQRPKTPSPSIRPTLLLAFLGGLLLNLMPCVFPVLSIKALTFTQSGHSRRVSGVVYGLGVVLTMLLLAGVFLLLRSAGSGLGWGFQLQSTIFVSLLAGLFTLIGLNLIGVFEIRVILPDSISNLRSRTPALDAFFSGIISVLIATPCTAPFMGAALGVALVMPVWQALLVFLALGVGLALPLVAIAYCPALIRWLPKPGAWMDTFRKVMAFPMFATVLWLVWVVGLQTSLEGAIGLLTVLLVLSLLVWVFGHSLQNRRTGAIGIWQKLGVALCLVLFILATSWVVSLMRTVPADIHANLSSPHEWQPWSKAKVDTLLTEGKTVFVDFTAAWCVTCQMNKHTTLRQPEVLKAFADKGVVLLEADWTRPDPAISQALERLGRSGVPVYVLFCPNKVPQLLPEVLTPGIVLQALDSVP